MLIDKTWYQEVPQQTVAGTLEYFIGDIVDLRKSPIYGIEFYDANDVTKTLSGADPVPTADLQTAYIQLFYGDENGFYITAPVYQFVRLRNNSTAHPFVEFPDSINGKVISWQKSKITFGTAPTAGKTIAMNIYYKVVSS